MKPRILMQLRENPNHENVKVLRELLNQRQHEFMISQRIQHDIDQHRAQFRTQQQQQPGNRQASWRSNVSLETRRKMFDLLVQQIMIRPPFSQLPRTDRQMTLAHENLVRKFVLEQVTELWKMSESEDEFLTHMSLLPERIMKLYNQEM